MLWPKISVKSQEPRSSKPMAHTAPTTAMPPTTLQNVTARSLARFSAYCSEKTLSKGLYI